MTVIAENQGYVVVKAESSYGVDPTTVIPTNLIYVDSAEIEGAAVVIQREGMSPYQGGFKPVAGPDDVTVTLETEIPLLTLSTGSEVSAIDPLLLAAGFTAATSTPTNRKRRTYTARSFGATGSVAVEIFEHVAANDDGWKHQALGVRFDWTIRLDPAARWVLALTGAAASYSRTATGAARSTSVDYALATPVVSGAATCSIVRVKSGTDQTYPAAGRVVSLEVSGNNGAQIQRGICGQRVDFAPSTPITGTLVVEAVDADDFDPWAAIEAGDLIEIAIGSPSGPYGGTASGDSVAIAWTAYVESVTRAADSGAKTWSLSLFGGYPQDSSDGGGLKPADTFTLYQDTYTAP